MAFVNIVRIQVTAEYAGRRLDHVLTAEIADRTRSQIQRLIKKGLVHVGNKVAAVSTVVREGDCVTLKIPPPEPATPIVANPAPISLAASTSFFFPFVVVNINDPDEGHH